MSALFAAGALDRPSFLRVARQRGELMARAAEAEGGGGAMTAVAAPVGQVESVLGEYGSDVVVANHNDPRQVVISGSTAAIEEAERRFIAAGVKVQRLPVAAAFHSPIVAGSVAPFAKALEAVAFQAPSLPVFAGATAEPYPAAPEAVRDLLASSIARRVRFVDVVEAMYARGVRTFVEVGPGSVLSAMISRICGERPHRAIPLDRPGRHGVTSLWQSLAQLAVAGHAVDFSALWREFDLGPDPRAEPKPKMTVRISGTNYGKKYPPEGGAAGLPRPNPPRAQVAKQSNGEVMETKEQKSSTTAPETTEGRAREAVASMPRAPAPRSRANGGKGARGERQRHRLDQRQREGSGARRGRPQRSVARHAHPRAGVAPGRRVGRGCTPTSPSSAARPRRTPSTSSRWRSATSPSCGRPSNRRWRWRRWPSARRLSASRRRGAWRCRPPHAEEHDSFAMAALPAIQWSPPAHAPAPPPPMARPPAPRAPTPVAVSDAGLAAIPSPAPVVRAPAPAPVPAAAFEAPKAAPAPSSALAMPADGDLKTFLFNVISEKTGYPVEILNLDQQLEADLGIDSIKRVEILSAFEGQIPDIKDVNLEEVASLSTLRDVVGFMEKFSDKLGLAKKKE